MNAPARQLIEDAAAGNIKATQAFFAESSGLLEQLASTLANAFGTGNKLLVCGNGGSACEAMHIAGEFVGRYQDDRRSLPAVALSADGGLLTAVGNDYGFDHVFARQIEGLGNRGDVLVAMSTSGASPNVLAALEAARGKGIFTALLTGEKGRGQTGAADLLLVVPSAVTARVQEVHLTALHLLATLVEAQLFKRSG